MLQRAATETLTEQLAGRFAARIRDRLLAPGTRLPSVRQCAAQHQVSPSTVVAAYDQLLAGGLVEARRNRGFYVRDWARKVPPALAESAQAATESRAAVDPTEARRLSAPISAATLMRGMFGADGKPQPGMGVLPPDWLDNDFMAAALRRAASGSGLRDSSVRYGDPRGDPQLRQVLAARLQAQGAPA